MMKNFFKWAVIAALCHEQIDAHTEHISKLKPFVSQYNWDGLEFPVAVNKLDKFEKNNPDVAVNVLFTGKKDIFIARKSKFNSGRNKQVNLLMIIKDENRHYTAIKNISRLLSSENTKHKEAYHFCINWLNGFRTESARDKHDNYCSSNCEVKVKMSEDEDKWLQYHDGQFQFKVPFILYADFESILKPVDETECERKEESYTEKINTHVPSG